eukprot:5056615-Amphidinium_carterae.1
MRALALSAVVSALALCSLMHVSSITNHHSTKSTLVGCKRGNLRRGSPRAPQAIQHERGHTTHEEITMLLPSVVVTFSCPTNSSTDVNIASDVVGSTPSKPWKRRRHLLRAQSCAGCLACTSGGLGRISLSLTNSLRDAGPPDQPIAPPTPETENCLSKGQRRNEIRHKFQQQTESARKDCVEVKLENYMVESNNRRLGRKLRFSYWPWHHHPGERPQRRAGGNALRKPLANHAGCSHECPLAMSF